MPLKTTQVTIFGDSAFRTFDVMPRAETSAIAVGGYSLSGSADAPLFDVAGTWNTTGTPSALKLNILNTASNTASRLLDLQVGSVAKFFVGLDGSFVSTGLEFDLGSTANANNTIKFVRPAASGINMIDFDAISGAPNLSFVRKYTASPFRMELAGPTDVDIVIDSNNDSTSNFFRVLTNGINNAGTLVFSVSEAGDTVALGSLTAGNALFNVTGTTGVLKLANGTDPAANPTNATTQWAVGGEWQYRSSAASEGAGQTNRVHNRAAVVLGAGTDYALTTTLARIDFGTTDPLIVLPTAGTYLLEATVLILFNSVALSIGDIVQTAFRNVTDNVTILNDSPTWTNLSATTPNYSTMVAVSIQTITASKTFEIWAANYQGARGVAVAAYTCIRYIRLY